MSFFVFAKNHFFYSDIEITTELKHLVKHVKVHLINRTESPSNHSQPPRTTTSFAIENSKDFYIYNNVYNVCHLENGKK